MSEGKLLDGLDWEWNVESPKTVMIQQTVLKTGDEYLYVSSAGWFNEYGCCPETWVFSKVPGIKTIQTHQRSKEESEKVHKHLVKNYIKELRKISTID